MSKTRVTIAPGEIAQKWGRNMKNAVGDIVAGVDRVMEAPGQKAAAAAPKMKQKLNEAIDSGRYAKAVSAVSLEDWKEKTKAKVQARLSQGVDSAMGKREKFDTANVAALNQILPNIAKMPSLTLEDNIARSSEYQRQRAKMKYK